MNVMIIGAGFTGIQLARRLINEGNIVKIVESDEDTVSRVSNLLDCEVVAADGNNLAVLEDLGIAKQDALVTLTDSDEINMITCSLVDAVYPGILKIARVRNYAYYANTANTARAHASAFGAGRRPLYGIDRMIHPDVEAAGAIVKAAQRGAVSLVVDFGDDGNFEVITLEVLAGSRPDGAALADLRRLAGKRFIVAWQETHDARTGGTSSSLPSGESVLHAGDRIGVIARREDVPDLLAFAGRSAAPARHIALVGIGRVGTLVADSLTAPVAKARWGGLFGYVAPQLAIIDSDRELCVEAERRFPRARIFNADVTDDAFIREENIQKCNLMIFATHNHELNIVAAAYLESLGVEKTIALVEQSQFGAIATRLGIDVAVPMRDTVVDAIISHLHGSSVTGIHTVSNGAFEIVEFELPDTSKFVGRQLKDVSRAGDFLVLLVRKAGSTGYELPEGSTSFSASDRLVIIQKAGGVPLLEKTYKVKTQQWRLPF